MKKNLIHSYKNSTLALARTKNLRNITNKLLSNKNSELVDDSWIDRLWKWADENDIPDAKWIENTYLESGGYWEGIPRERNKLLNVKNITLYHNYNLTELPEEICNLSNLQELDISNTTLTILPKNIHNLKKLTKLDLCDNELQKIPKGVYSLINLEELDLSNYSHDYRTTTLEELELSNYRYGNNRITKLSKKIGNLTNLTKLSLLGTQLIELPKEIGNLTNLTELDLSDNSFTELPKEIGNLTKLTTLSLWGTQLTHLPREIKNLSNLTKLTLKCNKKLILTYEQKKWIKKMESDGCIIERDSQLFGRINYGLLYSYDLKTKNIIPKNKDELNGYEWVEKLWKWADTNQIPEQPWIGYLYLYLLDSSDCKETLDECDYSYEGYVYGGGFPRVKEILLNTVSLCLDPSFYHYNFTFTNLPKEIGNLTDLTTLYLENNPNLILTTEQKEWINELKNNGCNVRIDDDLLNRKDTSLSKLELDDSWIERLWEWADKNEIPDYYLAQDSEGFDDAWNYFDERRSRNIDGLSIFENRYIDYHYINIENYYFDIGKFGLSRDYNFLSKISSLYLRDLNLISLDKTIGKLINLKELNIGGNLLEQIPKELCELNNLKVLDLSDNKLKGIPKELSKLVNLKELNLRSNNLEEIPIELFELTNLEILDLGNNKLKEIPKGLSKLVNLKVLILRDNNLLKFPDGLTNLKNIEVLFLRRNNFEVLNNIQYEFYSKIEELDYSYDYVPINCDFRDNEYFEEDDLFDIVDIPNIDINEDEIPF